MKYRLIFCVDLLDWSNDALIILILSLTLHVGKISSTLYIM